MKRIVVLGAGESGTGAAILAKCKGMDVFVSDFGSIAPAYQALLTQHHIAWEEGKHSADLILNADEVIKSPGIPLKAPIIQQLINQGIPIISEIEFAARYSRGKMICITGSNGKTTTTSLLFDMLRRAGLDVGLAGNIGNSLALQVAQEDHDYYVIELSSFQLDNCYDFKADIAILLNITPDHLDRYDHLFQNYVDAKFRITNNQTKQDAFIYWSEDPVIDREIQRIQPQATLYPFGSNQQNVAYTDGSQIVLTASKTDPLYVPINEMTIQGTHNQYNSMAAGLAAQILHIHNNVIPEDVAAVYINDLSKNYAKTISSFSNCIITGGRKNNVVVATPLANEYQGQFVGNYLRADSLSELFAHNNVYAAEEDTAVFRNIYYQYKKYHYYDFRLDSLSPARGIADSIIALKFPIDRVGNTRKPHPDAGCYEFSL